MKKRLNVCRWLEREFPGKLDDGVKALLNVRNEDVKFFDDWGYIDYTREKLHVNRVAEVVEILTGYMRFGYSESLIIDIVKGLHDLERDLNGREDNFWNDKRYSKFRYREIYEEAKELLYNHLIPTFKHDLFFNDNIIIWLAKLSNFIELGKGGYNYFWDQRKLIIDKVTIMNIRDMVKRADLFLGEYGTLDYRVRLDGYGDIAGGVVDFCTEDTMIDMKVKREKGLWDRDIRQMFVYALLAQRMGKEIKYAVIFNPRFGTYFKIDLQEVPDKYYDEIKRKWKTE